jgi:PAS domain S-box-containing protein
MGEARPPSLGTGASTVRRRSAWKANREQLAFLLGCSHELIAVCSSDFEILFINQAGLEMVGLSAGGTSPQPTSLQKYFFPEDVPYLFGEFFPRALREGQPETEVRLRHVITGEPLWLVLRVSPFRDAAGNVTALVATGPDVTELKQAEEQLRVSEERFRTYLELGLIGGIAETDLNGCIIFVNDRYSAIVGLTREELLSGRTLQSLIHSEEWRGISERLHLLLATGEPFQVENRYTRPDGSCVWVSNSVSCIRAEDGSAKSLMFLSVDIGERKRAEERIEKAYADVEHQVQERTSTLSAANAALQEQIAERLSIESDRDGLTRRLGLLQEQERRRIARELHDDFAQRLAALQMQVEMYSNDSGEALMLRRLSQQIESLSSDLRSLSHRLHPSILEDLGIEVALTALVDSMEDAHGLQVSLQIRGLPPDLPLPASTALYRIAQEALRNVVKHTDPGVSVAIELSSQGSTAQLTVRDTGRGFDLQSVRSHGGIGLGGIGLASMHERARLVGGDLTLQTAPGRGTTVTAIVPLTAVVPIGIPRVVV